MQLAAQQHKVAEHERHLREMVERVIPASIAEATRAERKEGEKRKERLQKEADMLRQAVQEQRVLKAQLVKSHAAKMEDLEARLTAAEEYVPIMRVILIFQADAKECAKRAKVQAEPSRGSAGTDKSAAPHAGQGEFACELIFR
jgi:hypothetical protein